MATYPEDALVTKLKATSAVTTLVGAGTAARIRPVQLNDHDALPAITYQRVGTRPVNHAGGQCNVAFSSVQVNCLASTYTGAKALGAVVRAALSGYVETGEGAIVDMVHWVGETDIPQGIEAGQDVQIHGVAHDFLLQHST